MAEGKGISRRELLKRAGIGAGGLAVSGAAAPQVWAAPRVSQADQTIKIGFVSPLTGPAAGFGEPDPYVLGLAEGRVAKGITIGGKTYDVEIIDQGQPVDADAVRPGRERPDQHLERRPDADDVDAGDRQPGLRRAPRRRASRASRRSCRGRPGTSAAGQAGRSPRRSASPTTSASASRKFCQRVHAPVAAGPDQQDGRRDVAERRRRQRDPRRARAAAQEGRLHDRRPRRLPGRHQRLHGADLEVQAGQNCEIFNTFPIPPDFATFWQQAAQQGYKPIKIAQIAKTGLFPSQVEALGSLGNDLASGVYWAPTWPYTSSLTGVTLKQLAAGYDARPKQAVEPAGGREPRAVRRRRRGAQGERQPEGQAGGRERDEDALGRDAARASRVGQGPGAERRRDADHRRPVGARPKGGPVQAPVVICENSDDHNVPIAAKLKPYNA